jgi:hypothetical protein
MTVHDELAERRVMRLLGRAAEEAGSLDALEVQEMLRTASAGRGTQRTPNVPRVASRLLAAAAAAAVAVTMGGAVLGSTGRDQGRAAQDGSSPAEIAGFDGTALQLLLSGSRGGGA